MRPTPNRMPTSTSSRLNRPSSKPSCRRATVITWSKQGVILPLEQLLKQALDRYPGSKLLEAELEEKHDVYIYEVELLTTEGVVRELDVNASTGQLLKDEED